MSGLAGVGICQVAITLRVLKLTTEIVPAVRFETYSTEASRLGYRPCAPAPVCRKPLTRNVDGLISHSPPVCWSAV